MALIHRAETIRRQTKAVSERLLRNSPDLANYLEDPGFTNLGPNTKLSYLRDLEAFIKTVSRQIPTTDDLRAYLEEYRKKGFSAATLRRVDASLRRFLASQDRGRDLSPNTDIVGAWGTTRPPKPSRLLSVDDVSRLLDTVKHASNTRNAGLVAVAAGTGATGDQIVALNQEDVFPINGRVAVALGVPRPRTVSLDPVFGEVISAHAQTREPGQSLFRRDRNDNMGDLRLSYAGLSYIFHTLGVGIDWPTLNPRDFRRFFLTQHQPTNAREIASLLHLSPEQASRYR